MGNPLSPSVSGNRRQLAFIAQSVRSQARPWVSFLGVVSCGIYGEMRALRHHHTHTHKTSTFKVLAEGPVRFTIRSVVGSELGTPWLWEGCRARLPESLCQGLGCGPSPPAVSPSSGTHFTTRLSAPLTSDSKAALQEAAQSWTSPWPWPHASALAREEGALLCRRHFCFGPLVIFSQTS